MGAQSITVLLIASGGAKHYSLVKIIEKYWYRESYRINAISRNKFITFRNISSSVKLWGSTDMMRLMMLLASFGPIWKTMKTSRYQAGPLNI